ncbi:MAG: isoleucine--tRNA ligase [Legionellaceae bacterium]|nr:isoleucine--tRNA ligase [Legionellaceae bacterium]
MAEYKDTLNLPKTDFPMKASLSQREPRRLQQWQDTALWEQMKTQMDGRPAFILHDGPPYANGHLHCGHALNKILKDIVVKSKVFSGYRAPYVPGWDCHGLPIELNVEKKFGKAGRKLSAADFRLQCRNYATEQVDIQRQEFIRLGVFGDWSAPYTTMNYQYEANIVRALGKIIANGHLHQGFKPVHWCLDCASSLAEAEVEYEDKTSPSIDVAFQVIAPRAFLDAFDTALADKPVVVPIWTTTPWTLPANEAVCLHPELDYQLLALADHYMLVAAELVDVVIQRFALENPARVGLCKGRVLEHFRLSHPFQEREVPIVLGEHVTTEAGTGCVHTAPVHGPDDYKIGLHYDLPLHNPLMSNGCFIDSVPHLAGVHVYKANALILELLEEKGALLHHEALQHSYPHCWRHKTPVIFLATPQWFIAMDKNGLRAAILEQIDTVNFIPDWGKARIRSMVETRPDWCISRQRAWGTPLPLFIHKETRELHPDTLALIEQVALRIERDGIEAWFALDSAELLKEDATYYDKLHDTLDVWFDSGVSHFAVLSAHAELSAPADIYLEGSDQHRGWFNSSLTTAVAIGGKAPYRTVLTHGYTVDEQGRKLSKSKGNYVALDQLIEQHGADILRLWVASTDYRNEVSISEQIIGRIGDAYRRIRNTARFLLANLFDFEPQKHCLPAEQLVELDRWIIKRAQILQEAIVEAYASYQFHQVYQKVHHFCAIDLGSFYLDIIKDRQYTTATHSIARRSCQTAMYHIVQALSCWLAPVLSFTAEEIWEAIPHQSSPSVFLHQWYESWPEIDSVNMEEWALIQMVREDVNKALERMRKEGGVGSALAAELILYVDAPYYPALSRLGDELRFVMITSSARVHPWDERPDIEGLYESETMSLAVQVISSTFEKCARCWHRRPEVGQSEQHPELCARCEQNIGSEPEVRIFA